MLQRYTQSDVLNLVLNYVFQRQSGLLFTSVWLWCYEIQTE